MEIIKTHKIIISILVVIVLFGAYIALDDRSKISQNEEESINNSLEVATTTPNSSTQTITNSDGTTYTIEKITPPTAKVVPKPIPDLNRILIKSPLANVSEGNLAIATEKIKELQSLLKGNPVILTAWLDLANYQKMGGDWEGAIISWQYAGKLAPTGYVSFANLGNLYAYHLKDMKIAEQYYNQAIKNAPTQIYLYFQLAEAFRDVSNDMTKARAVIDRGLVANPGNQELLALKATLN